jgi:UDP-N-acetylmuramyl pentapeptide phosphotransferase/UDP-N-acetylglucosamine-1-phosphate transferase
MAPRPQGSHLTIVLVLATAAFAASALLSGMLRRYALTHSLLDVPNERSLYSIPTPRGAGLAIVLVFLGGLAALWALGLTPTRLFMALAGGAAMVAAAGWWDDREGMPAGVRLAVHAAAAVWALPRTPTGSRSSTRSDWYGRTRRLTDSMPLSCGYRSYTVRE